MYEWFSRFGIESRSTCFAAGRLVCAQTALCRDAQSKSQSDAL